MATHLIPIGRFAQITRLSLKALRLYGETGLLPPVYVDPESGYRYYSLAQAAVAARIRLLRSVDMSLEDIQTALQAPNEAAVGQLLAKQQQRLSARITRDQEALLLLQRIVEKPDRFLAFAAQVKEVPEQTYLSLHQHAAYGTFGPVIRSALITLIEFAARSDIYRPELPPLIISHQYDSDQFRERGVDLEVAVPTSRLVDAESRITSSLLPGGLAASVVHIGPYRELEVIYPALGMWIEEQGYIPTGPPRNAILTNYPIVTNPTEYQTEVLWPVKRREEVVALSNTPV
jgi:DNA-binding transcriptional MerR regulator